MLKQESFRGIIYLAIGVGAFVVQDLIIKISSDTYPLHQALSIRALAAIPVALLFVFMTGTMKALKGSTRAMWPRSMLLVITNMSYYLALALVPLATANALYLTAPFLITILSVLFLKERVSFIQWAAVAAGFVGVILIIHPGEGAFEWAMALPLLSALSYACSVIFVRKMQAENDASIIAFQGAMWLSFTGVIMGAMLGFGELGWEIQQHPSADFLLRGWQWPNTSDVILILVGGAVGSAAMLFLTKAYATSSASVLAPFEYTALLWSIVLGWLIFSHLPSAREWLGIVILVAAGLASALHTRQDNPQPGGVAA